MRLKGQEIHDFSVLICVTSVVVHVVFQNIRAREVCICCTFTGLNYLKYNAADLNYVEQLDRVEKYWLYL